MRLFLVTSVLHASAVTVVIARCVWPSRYDFLEDLLAIQSGYISFGFTSVVAACENGQGAIGRQNSAEWIRAAFHDMATHEKAAGTGGLDASIMYELDRDENAGDTFNQTFADMASCLSPRASATDLLALSVVSAVAGCGGQRIPFRVGRVDATHAGPPGRAEAGPDS